MSSMQQAKSSGLRERKKLETRDALADAAMRLALKHGLDGLRVEDIAAEANVSMRTFNNYFSTKQEALVARYTNRMIYAAEALRARPAAEPIWEAITEAMIAPWKDTTRGQAIPSRAAVSELRLIFGASSTQAEILRGALISDHPFVLAVADRTGTDPQRDLYPRLVAAVVTTAAQVAINAFLHGDQPTALVPLLRDTLALLCAGLPPPSGTQPIFPRGI
ncbi:Transcriptional regulator, TetR family [Granulibacter bethesdensis]|uniref:Transcriptional regulator, TetR family n=1 Tax=Granulibacter bethesdensis TaxID=364410 RepID=A0AAC9P8E3_9PROT|nr:TetR/AcrR family transcriptional regulator [Granulibacter bethesdensis]APH54437.1 Transcriptional regulator, TetR family [Granulibacter bethesdensis]APH62023.1 Transcriptional regulator, TetR family [Granulibacter bethesdensis]